MISFERCFDADLIRAVLTSPEIYDAMGDDFSPAAADYIPPKPEEAFFVAVRVNGDVKGLWVFVMLNRCCWEVHTALLPSIHGMIAFRAAKLMAQWIWKNTECRRLITTVPEYNKAANLFARSAGFTEFGRNEKSILKGGILHTQVMLGLSKPENTCP